MVGKVIYVKYRESAMLANWSSDNVPLRDFYYLSRRIPREYFMELYHAKALEPYDDVHYQVNGKTVWVVDIDKAKELGYQVVIE